MLVKSPRFIALFFIFVFLLVMVSHGLLGSGNEDKTFSISDKTEIDYIKEKANIIEKEDPIIEKSHAEKTNTNINKEPQPQQAKRDEPNLSNQNLSSQDSPALNNIVLGNFNSSDWQTGGSKRGVNGYNSGEWNWSHQDTKGYHQMRTWGPQSGNTYGADAWMRNVKDYNDGKDHIINFQWNSSVNAYHWDMLAIQINNGSVPIDDEILWPTYFSSLYLAFEAINQPPCGNNIGMLNANITSWSININRNVQTATLYGGANLTGDVLCQESLNANEPWYLRFIITDATSSGFPEGDNSFFLHDYYENTQARIPSGNYHGYLDIFDGYNFYINHTEHTIKFDGANASNQYDHYIVPYDSQNRFVERINYIWFSGWFDTENLYLNDYVGAGPVYSDTAIEISPGVYYADFVFPGILYTGAVNVSADVTIDTNTGQHTIYPNQYPQLTSTKDVDPLWQTAGHDYGAVLLETKLVERGGQNIIEIPLWVKEDLASNGENPHWTAPLTVAWPSYFNPANGHTYVLILQPMDIVTARTKAIAMDGYLVAINDSAENAFIVSSFYPLTNTLGYNTFIGLSDEITEGSYLWDSGENFSYSNWCVGEPNNDPNQGGEDYAEIKLHMNAYCIGQWNDVSSTSLDFALIEIPSAPPTTNQTNATISNLDVNF